MRLAIVVVFALFCVLFAVDVAYRVSGFPTGWPAPDVVTVVLGAVAIMLAIVTIFLGILALFGYFHIRDLTVQTATSVAKTTAEEVATRTVSELSGQETGRGGRDEYAQGAAGASSDRSTDAGS